LARPGDTAPGLGSGRAIWDSVADSFRTSPHNPLAALRPHHPLLKDGNGSTEFLNGGRYLGRRYDSEAAANPARAPEPLGEVLYQRIIRVGGQLG
jgi:hypothetical protein